MTIYNTEIADSGFFADGISNWEVGDVIWFENKLLEDMAIESICASFNDKKECTCLTSDLMIKGCTCGGK